MTLHTLYLENMPIFEQLVLEEALLRGDTRNWCIINRGSTPAIVMGISGKPHELIDLSKVGSHMPVIKRFSGGGTVVVDENTLFVTFIFQKEAHDFHCFPEPIMQWSHALYKAVFPMDFFALRENDYVLKDKKCGGNAQYIKKDRWLLHTSFLWDYHPKNMDYLLHPKKTPRYREDRAHTDFLCRLKEYFPFQDTFLTHLKDALASRYNLQAASYDEIRPLLGQSFRQTTTYLTV